MCWVYQGPLNRHCWQFCSAWLLTMPQIVCMGCNFEQRSRRSHLCSVCNATGGRVQCSVLVAFHALLLTIALCTAAVLSQTRTWCMRTPPLATAAVGGWDGCLCAHQCCGACQAEACRYCVCTNSTAMSFYANWGCYQQYAIHSVCDRRPGRSAADTCSYLCVRVCR